MGKGISGLWALWVQVLFLVLWCPPGHAIFEIGDQDHLTSVPGELIVSLKENPYRQDVLSVMHGIGTSKLDSIIPLLPEEHLYKIKLKEAQQLGEVLSHLRADSNIEFVEPNYIYRILASQMSGFAPNDEHFGSLWGMLNTGLVDSEGQLGVVGADIAVTPVWASGHFGSRDIVVAVIDTGVDLTHPELAENIYVNPGEAGPLANNGIDDDLNGFVDDVNGWNFVTHTNKPQDDHGHGTHCAGIMGAQGNNMKGVAGVNWKLSIMPLKFLQANGSGSLDAALLAIGYATKMGVKIMSNSWGGGPFSQAMFNAVQKAKDAGILFVAAAGNNSKNNDQSPTYPATYALENVVSVSATDNRDALSSFSNYGKNSVHLAAPGTGILSMVVGGGYKVYSGTSMAAPHAAGAAAILLSIFPNLSFSDLKDRLIRSSQRVALLRNKVVAQGRIHLANAVAGIFPPGMDPDPNLWIKKQKIVESMHPYEAAKESMFTIASESATFIRVHFEKVDVERNFDFIQIETPDGEVVDKLTGKLSDYTSAEVSGNQLVVRLISDQIQTAWGFKIDSIEVISP